MATSNLIENSLVIRYQVGVDKKGNEVFKQQNLKNINPEVADDELVALSDGIEMLMDHTVSTIKKNQSYMVTR
jgi:Protein of unknown function (DUF1659)